MITILTWMIDSLKCESTYTQSSKATTKLCGDHRYFSAKTWKDSKRPVLPITETATYAHGDQWYTNERGLSYLPVYFGQIFCSPFSQSCIYFLCSLQLHSREGKEILLRQIPPMHPEATKIVTDAFQNFSLEWMPQNTLQLLLILRDSIKN